MESHPDRFYRCLNIQSYKENLLALCDFIGTKPENTVLLENVTTGILLQIIQMTRMTFQI